MSGPERLTDRDPLLAEEASENLIFYVVDKDNTTEHPEGSSFQVSKEVLKVILGITSTPSTTPTFKEKFFGAGAITSTAGNVTNTNEIVAHINSIGFTVTAGELLILTVAAKRLINGKIVAALTKWLFKKNNVAGAWGTGETNGEITTSDIIQLPGEKAIYEISNNASYIELGDIGSSTIEDYINALDPATVDWEVLSNDGTTYLFTCVQNGEDKTFRYVGTLPKVLGSGNTEVSDTDFDLIASNDASINDINFSPQSKTGTSIEFTENAYYNEETFLTSGNLILDLTDAVKGVEVVVFCKKYTPSITGEQFYFTGGDFDSSALNIIYFTYDGSNVYASITNVDILLAPSTTAIGGNTESVINWSIVAGADNYIIERSEDDFSSEGTEVYNGSLLTYTDTGLTNGTTYYYRIKTVGNGYITSDWSDTLEVTPLEGLDPNLIVWLDASDNDTITTVNGPVTVWADKTLNNNNVTESTNTPIHNDSSDYVSFSGVHNTSCDILSKIISDLYFQQEDDFTVVIKNLIFNNVDTEGTQHVIDNRVSTSNQYGWAVNLSLDGTTLRLAMTSSGANNPASYVNPSGWKDGVPRDFIFINEGGVTKIFDATNTNVGTNGTNTMSSISYGASTEFKLGANNKATSQYPFDGSFEVVKVYNKALNSSERAEELGL